MKVRIKSEKNFYAGLMFSAVGIAFAIGATNYHIGTSARMGPGYFPMMLGIILALLGGLVIFRSLSAPSETGDKLGKAAWRPLVFVIGANVLFGVLLGGLPAIKLPSMGLVAAIMGLTIVSGMAGDEFRLKESVILGAVLATLSYLAFVLLLKLQFQVWPEFITG